MSEIEDLKAELEILQEISVEGERYWTCKIGPAPIRVPYGGDAPLRDAVERAFHEMFEEWAMATFSGWGGHLTKNERAAAFPDRQKGDDDVTST